uniref:Uncharacterized protein n=1 Tax=Lepeophtheirus salmonis TaxID=72036 RepID=A0A0K2VHJ8_LEPSM
MRGLPLSSCATKSNPRTRFGKHLRNFWSVFKYFVCTTSGLTTLIGAYIKVTLQKLG